MQNLKNCLLLGGVVVAFIGTGLTGCESYYGGEARRTGRTPAQVETDKITTRRVQDSLKNAPIYKFHQVGVQTDNGVVQLNGFVDTDNQRRAAEDIARTVPGVQELVNGIAIKSQAAPTGRPNEPGQPNANQPNPNQPNQAPVVTPPQQQVTPQQQ